MGRFDDYPKNWKGPSVNDVAREDKLMKYVRHQKQITVDAIVAGNVPDYNAYLRLRNKIEVLNGVEAELKHLNKESEEGK